jgi:hypothetical protein
LHHTCTSPFTLWLLVGVDIGRVRVQTPHPDEPAGVEYIPFSAQKLDSGWTGSGESGCGLNSWVQTGWTNYWPIQPFLAQWILLRFFFLFHGNWPFFFVNFNGPFRNFCPLNFIVFHFLLYWAIFYVYLTWIMLS